VDSSSPRGVRLVEKRPFSYGNYFWGDHISNHIMWRAIRHDFLFPKIDEWYAMGHKKVKTVPDVGLFSFEHYLRLRMGKIVLSVIHLDRWTWLVTLGLLALPLWAVKAYPWIPSEFVHCFLAWTLALLGLIMTAVLQRDTFLFTPPVPRQVLKIMHLFSGESFQILRRAKLPGWLDRPILDDPDHEQPQLEHAPALIQKRPAFFKSDRLRLYFRMLSFLQAVSVTSLILSHLSEGISGRANLLYYLLAWAEWPFMLFVLFPIILRRLTIRSSIAFEKDDKLIRKVTTSTKESLLRDYGRLAQVIGMERRAVRNEEGWTAEQTVFWHRRDAMQWVLRGLRKYDTLPMSDRREFWVMFAAWDAADKGVAAKREISEAFRLMGVHNSERTVENIIRLVNFDGKPILNWMKMKAVFGLACAERPAAEVAEDLRWSFDYIDANGDGQLTIFEMADAFKCMHLGLTIDDIANLLFIYFGGAKPTITRQEFVDFVMSKKTKAARPHHEAH